MKHFIPIIFLIISNIANAQSESRIEKFRNLEPDIWLNIWDEDHSEENIKVQKLNYDEIPKYLNFRGTVVEALKWYDKSGENILIQTVTGHFKWKDYYPDTTEYMLQDKSELYAYLFHKSITSQTFKPKWRLYDFTECFGVDWYTGFIPKATTITDLDGDGLTEISIPYVLICRGGVDPGTMKIIMYEGSSKYALRGSTMVACESQYSFGGEFQPSKNLNDQKTFLNFLIGHWNLNKCENDRFH
ncbi:hypothetical protein KFE94_02930 [bacterium SCSIO 12643]|nr:hypothetical protein KFE94_02930 [bacterium SCSIO 12643]